MTAWIPALPPIQPDSLLALWNLTETEAQSFDSLTVQKLVPVVAKILPEFSQQELTAAIAQTTDSAPTTQTKYFKPTQKRRFASGSEMYFQRLAALRAGHTYTRLPSDDSQPAWMKEAFSAPLPLQKPTYEQWQSLLAQEARAVATGQGANRLSVMVGDSLSLWFPSEQLPAGQFWLNQGISGDTSGGILKRLSAFSQTRPQAIYIMAGINDLRRGAADDTILNNLRQIVERLRLAHPNSSIVVQSILPTRLAAIPNSRIRRLNQQIATIAQHEGASYMNLHPLFVDFEGNLRRNLTTDGVHLSQRGYEIWQWSLQQTDLQAQKQEPNQIAGRI